MGVEGNHNLYPSYKAEMHKWLPNLVGARRKKNIHTTEESPRMSNIILGFLVLQGRRETRNAKKQGQ